MPKNLQKMQIMNKIMSQRKQSTSKKHINIRKLGKTIEFRFNKETENKFKFNCFKAKINSKTKSSLGKKLKKIIFRYVKHF
jgi:hypothetical protein